MPISEVYNEDCMIMMRRYPNKFFDLAIVDPPYGIGVSSHSTFGNPDIIAKNSFLKKLVKPSNYKISNWDSSAPDEHYFNELKRVSIKQIIWGVNYFDGFGLKGGRLFWDKEGTGNYSRGELAYLSFVNRVEYFKYRWCGMLQEKMGDDKEDRIHQTQKPVQLYKWCLKNYAKTGDKILDTHMGSQSSRIAAHRMGFDYYGCEIDKEYFEKGNKRFKEQTSQLQIFQ
jgi:site-specific DNA-methyltransferase (adenine-specific)